MTLTEALDITLFGSRYTIGELEEAVAVLEEEAAKHHPKSSWFNYYNTRAISARMDIKRHLKLAATMGN